MSPPAGVVNEQPLGSVLAGRRPRVRRSLNVPLLVVTAVALAVLGPGAYVWHRHQMPRVATAMLERADRLEKEQDWRSAAAYLYRYLQLCPEDGRVRARLAEVFDRSVQDDRQWLRAVRLYYEAIAAAPPENEAALRARLGEVFLELGRKRLAAGSYGFAEEQARKLLESNPADPRARRILALALYGEHQSGEMAAKGLAPRTVGEAVDRAVERNPGDLELAKTVATIYREEPALLSDKKATLSRAEREQEANRILDEAVKCAVKLDSENPEAYLVRCEYRTKYELPGADADLQAALKRGPDNAKVLMAAGDYAYREARRLRGDRNSAERVRQLLAAARGHFGRLVDLQPTSEIGYLGLGYVELADGKPERAEVVLRQGIQKTGKDSLNLRAQLDLKTQLAESLLQQGQLEAAETAINALEQAIADRAPWLPPRERVSRQQTAARLRGKWLVQKGRLLAAVPILRQAGLEMLSTGSQRALEKELAQLGLGQVRQGEAEELFSASRLLALHQKEPIELEPIRRLADLALKERDSTELQKWEGKLRDIGGPSGPDAQYIEARRFLAESKAVDDAAFAQAARLQASLQREHPAWPPGAALRGMILEARNKLSEAAEAYQEANGLENRGVFWAYERLVTVLYRTEPQELLALHQKRPADLEVVLQLAHLALERRDIEELQKWENKLSDLEGSKGLYTSYVKARRLLAQSKAVDEPVFAEAERLQASIQRDRSTWTLGVTLRGIVLEARNKLSEAAEAYQEAIRLGERHIWAYERLVAVLYRLRRFAEVDRYLARLGDEVSSSPGLSSLEMSIALQRNQPDRAMETARRAVAQRPKDPMAKVLLGQVHLARKETDAAGKAFREAVGLAPADPRAYDALFAFHVRLKQPERAREVLGEFSKNVKLSDGERAFRLAQGYELLGDRRAAETQYREAIRLAPESRGVCVRAAAFLAQRGGKENLRKAVQILERLVADPGQATPNDRIQLAQLLELDGKLGAAREQYLSVLGRPNPNPSYIIGYVDLLLRNNLAAEAAEWLTRLEQAAPDDLRTVSLRARWLKASGHAKEIEKLVDAFVARAQKVIAGDKQREAQLAAGLGNLYSQLEEHAAAERWYRRLKELAPESYQPLAVSLARQGRTREGVELCLAAAAAEGARLPAAKALVGVLVSGSPAKEECYRLAEPVFAQVLEKRRDNPDLLVDIAVVRFLQQQMDDAERLLRQALGADGKHTLAMNNLATLLAEKPGGRPEASQLIERAIDAAGPQPGLLDTKGWILLLDGKPEEAARLLEEASSAQNSDPRFRFHLALAYQRQGQLEKARGAFQMLRRAELDRQILTTQERKMLAELDARLR